MTRYAADFTVDISDLATEDEIRDRIESVLAEYRPTVTVVTREYETGR